MLGCFEFVKLCRKASGNFDTAAKKWCQSVGKVLQKFWCLSPKYTCHCDIVIENSSTKINAVLKELVRRYYRNQNLS